jgi:very-short-patch-repair endonuclease
MFAVVDLGNEDLLLIVEAEGYETHGTRKGLRRDCVRHTEFAVFGWTSLRYAYEDVMFEQEWVRWSLLALLAHRAGTKKPACPRRARAA